MFAVVVLLVDGHGLLHILCMFMEGDIYTMLKRGASQNLKLFFFNIIFND